MHGNDILQFKRLSSKNCVHYDTHHPEINNQVCQTNFI